MIQCPICKSQLELKNTPYCCPSCRYLIEEKDGIICFPLSASDEYFFPTEGFSVLYAHEADHFWFRSRNEIIGTLLQQFFPIEQRPLICEVGCGTGLISQYLTKIGYRMVCCDLFMEGLLFARERNSGEWFFRCNIYEFSFYDEFDAAIACDVLEHLDDDEIALNRMYQAIKPGGIVLITVPADNRLWSAIDIHAGHKRRYYAEELKKKVMEAGFNPIRVSYFMSVPYPILFLKRSGEKFIRLFKGEKTEEKIGVNELNIPKILNELLYVSLWPERKFIQSFNLPLGSSLICIAQKPLSE